MFISLNEPFFSFFYDELEDYFPWDSVLMVLIQIFLSNIYPKQCLTKNR